MQRYSPAADVKATSYMSANGDGAYYLASEVDARIAELERIRKAAAKYLKNWCMDEAYDPTCCCDQQHEEAKALRDALNACL